MVQHIQLCGKFTTKCNESVDAVLKQSLQIALGYSV